MEESSTYQWVIEKGMERGIEKGRQEGMEKGMEKGSKMVLKESLIDIGAIRFGQPDAAATAVLNSVDDMERLARMRHRLLDAANWDDLLGTP
ncbi:MAG TPA: hypothetical protein DDY78_20355 [Planctomycetales bacterium]|nr:hypothetical protein [Planctomycetales bacterium]